MPIYNNSLEYIINSDNTVSIEDVLNKSTLSGEFIVPKTIDGYEVAHISTGAFRYCDGLTSITIPDSVTSIGEEAFFRCTGLTSITIPDSVTSIGGAAFRDCIGLTSVNIGDGVTSIGEYAFEDCANLTSITIPDSVTNIGDYAFSNCYDLTSITISNNIVNMGTYVFSGCNSLESVVLPDSITVIEDGTFKFCEKLKSISMSNNVTNIGPYAFDLCKSLEEINIPESVVEIGNEAFNRCTSLSDIHYGGSYFSRKNINIGDTNDYLLNATWHYGKIETLRYEYNNENFTAIVVECVPDITENVEIPPTLFKGNNEYIVTGIDNRVFANFGGLTGVSIPNTIKTIGAYVFNNCTALKSITIPDSVTTIGERAFSYCEALTSVTLGGGLSSIGPTTFLYCTKLSDVVLKEGVSFISDYMFVRCSITHIKIPRSVEYIGYRAFERCFDLEEIIIYNTLTEIQPDAFASCTSLADVYYRGTPQQRTSQLTIDNSDDTNKTILDANWHYMPEGKIKTSDGLKDIVDAYVVKYDGDTKVLKLITDLIV